MTDAERIAEIRQRHHSVMPVKYDDIEWLLVQLDAATAEIAELRCQCQDKYAPRVWALEAENVRLRERAEKAEAWRRQGYDALFEAMYYVINSPLPDAAKAAMKMGEAIAAAPESVNDLHLMD